MMQYETPIYSQLFHNLKHIIINNLLQNHDKLHVLIHIGSVHIPYISLSLHEEKCRDLNYRPSMQKYML